jgi:hypothetical protein
MKNILDGRKDGQTNRGKTVYPPSPFGEWGNNKNKTVVTIIFDGKLRVNRPIDQI